MPINPQDNQDLERRLRELEAEVMRPTPLRSPERNTSPTRSTLADVNEWYGGLSTGGKIVVAVIGLLFASSLLSITLQLVALAVRLAVLGTILYLVYRFFLRR